MLTFTPKTPSPIMLVNAATKIEEKDNSKQNNTICSVMTLIQKN
ncbi:hypothetical protein OTSTA763_1520 [Orientia tsutsugamushi str. TA763]|nr:hypothetical protein OTSTA763_1520 [Orientia tsutsugamushi str. TA763]